MLAAASWRQALQTLRDVDNLRPWQLRETQMGPYLALEAVPLEKWAGAHGAGAAPALLDYHVCYSHSYQVPVMHFRAVSLDSGLPLAGDAVAALFPRGSWPQQPEQLVGFVGLQEHPLLPGSCWLALHPCNTAAALALALELQLGEAALAAADAAAAGGAVGEEAAAAAIASGAGAVCAVGAVQERYGGDREVAAAARGAGAERRGADQGTSEGVPQVVGAGGGVGGAGGSRCAEEQDGEAGVPDVDELLAAIAAAQQQARAGAGGEAGAGAAPAWAVVGPAGVRWPGDEVPVCPGEPALLARYMRAWLGLVGPYVGLRAGL